MISSEFKSTFERFVDCIDKLPANKLPEGKIGGPVAFLRQVRRDGAIEDLRDAQTESQAGNMEDAWVHLVKAAEAVGYLCGVNEADWLSAPEQGVIELLRKNGGLGGTSKGQNGERKRDAAAKALIEAAPNGKWPSKAAFELKYHSIVKKVPGFSDTDYQRRKMLSRPDIKATLTSDSKRKRG